MNYIRNGVLLHQSHAHVGGFPSAANCTFKWPLFSAKVLQNAPAFGENVTKKRPNNKKYAALRTRAMPMSDPETSTDCNPFVVGDNVCTHARAGAPPRSHLWPASRRIALEPHTCTRCSLRSALFSRVGVDFVCLHSSGLRRRYASRISVSGPLSSANVVRSSGKRCGSYTTSQSSRQSTGRPPTRATTSGETGSPHGSAMARISPPDGRPVVLLASLASWLPKFSSRLSSSSGTTDSRSLTI